MIHIQGAAGDKPRRPTQSRNKKWTPGHADGKNGHSNDGERWERGGHRGRRGRGRGGHGHHEPHLTVPTEAHDDGMSATTEDEGWDGDATHEEEPEPVPQADPESPEDREKFYKELSKQREIERKNAIAEGKMDDPLVPKRLEEAITMVGTCMDMCPRFERYRRERENNLDRWEVIPGTKRVDHKRAVKIYERAAGDKTIPSDLRPPPVLKRTLDYLFHDLMVREGFTATYTFIRDRSRAVRNDFTMQHETGPLAMECHDRCARFHILALHLERDNPQFSIALEEQQLMNTLQSLKEFYEDQRGRYQSPTELEMRVYHRLIHIRDQRERHEEIPTDIKEHPVFRLTTQFRLRVQAKSAPISKVSKLVVDSEAMQIFSQLAAVLREQNNVVMIYLVACIMERLFGKDCIDDIEAIRGDLGYPDIIDGISKPIAEASTTINGSAYAESPTDVTEVLTDVEEDEVFPEVAPESAPVPAPPTLTRSATEWLNNNFSGTNSSTNAPTSTSQSAFAVPGLTSSSSAFLPSSATSSIFSAPPSGGAPAQSAFGNLTTKASAFGGATFGPSSTSSKSVFGGGGTSSSVFGSSTPSVFGSHIQKQAEAITGAPTSGPTWPTGSSIFGSTSSSATSPPQPSQPPAGTFSSSPPSLNPFAPTFVPPQIPIAVPPLSSFAPSNPSPTDKPSLFLSNAPTNGTFGAAASPPKPSLVKDIFSIPFAPLQPSSTGPDASTSPQSSPPAVETPSRIVERRQTLWDLPGSSSPFSRLKEEKMTFTPPPGGIAEPRTPLSPTAPPPALGRVPNIALPPTPTARSFDPSSQSQESNAVLSRKQSMLHFPPLTMPAPAASDILSPIHLNTPAPGQTASAANGGPSPLFQSHVQATEVASSSSSNAIARVETSTTVPILSPVPLSKSTSAGKPILEIQTNGYSPTHSKKGKEKETEVDLDAIATKFLKTSRLVQDCWRTWRKRRETTKEWTEACRRSEQYKHRLKLAQGLGLGISSSQSADSALHKIARSEAPKKRRISVPTEMATAQLRRIKRRKSRQFVQPLTDDQLFARFSENHDDNKRRWAAGSFREAVVSTLKSRLAPDEKLSEWCTWLSVNSDHDHTAIWMENKFAVPDSGHWVSEHVFAIPAFNEPNAQGTPGLIVFERTPLEALDDDELEKKYRVLDDCARLRDIVQILPPAEERHYLPCLVVFNWSENADSEKARDFIEMTRKLVQDGVIKYVSYLNVPAIAEDMEKKFADNLSTIPLEIQDRLSVIVSWKDVRRLFVEPVETTISDLLDTCWPDDEFDWVRYERVMSSVGEILNSALRAILALFNDTPSHVLAEIPEDIPQPGAMGRGYATGSFAEALSQRLLSSAQSIVGPQLSTPRPIAKAVVDSAVLDLEKTIKTHVERLRQLAVENALHSSLGPSPKRPASDEDLRISSSMSFKRLRPSPLEDGVVETDVEGNDLSASPPPSTSGATDASDKQLITAAMLRALTKNMLKTFGS